MRKNWRENAIILFFILKVYIGLKLEQFNFIDAGYSHYVTQSVLNHA